MESWINCKQCDCHPDKISPFGQNIILPERSGTYLPDLIRGIMPLTVSDVAVQFIHTDELWQAIQSLHRRTK